MAWIALAEANAACGAEEGENAAAADVLAWLDGIGAVVRTSHESATLRLYDRTFHLRQDVSTDAREIRGLAHDLAEWLADGLQSDTTVQRTYYALVSGSFSNNAWTSVDAVPVIATTGPDADEKKVVHYHPAGIGNGFARKMSLPTEGRTVAANARRTNEADGWTVALTETVYGVPYTPDEKNVFVTEVVDPMAVGSVVSKASSRTFVFSFSGAVLFQTETTTVTEFAFLSKAEADEKVAANTSDAQYVRVSKSSSGVTVYREVKNGSQKTASARYVDEERGWTVSVTECVYGHTGW